jgi:murein DD-endopeptidase MepM/ murein hydrolase activator NlpD
MYTRLRDSRFRTLLTVCVVTAALSLAGSAAAARHHQKPAAEPAAAEPTVSAVPGTIVRWSAPGTKKCAMGKRTWPALHQTCYYPIDLLTKPGVVKVTRFGKGHSESAGVSVEAFEYPTQQVDLGNIPQADPTKDEMKRALREEAQTNKVFARTEGPARFALPLGAPAKPLPEGREFGSKRIFNDTPAGQPHMGADYTIVEGTPVRAVADGTVALAEDQFFAGNGVYIDHGDGLVSMYFHLSKIAVKAGQKVRKGQTIGLVGSTGRSTGAHLFFGVRWHDARINPELLLDDPAKIQAVDSQGPTTTPSPGSQQ